MVLVNSTVKEVISHMEENILKAVIVVDDNNIMKGLFTLGDMRHFFLHGGKLSDSISKAMNVRPIVFPSIYDAETLGRNLIVYPIIGEDGQVIDVIDGKEPAVNDALKDVPVVIMAGGKGTRLKPYTNVLPKALIPVGEVTITERIIESFCKYGCQEYYMILNHKAGMIKAYFQEIVKDYSVYFVQEDKFLGTGGGLSYLRGKIDKPFFLSNCDILIRADLECIYKTHKKTKNFITIVSAMKNIMVPYGVIQTSDSGEVIRMEEKPELSCLTNTGLYLIEPGVLKYIRENEMIHMTDIIKRVADIIMDTLVENGITDCFAVVGGGAMYLDNALALNDDIHKVFNHHEQACAMAAEAYAKMCGKMAAVCVTSGPGATNTLTGVMGAWQDSIPMIVLSGQVRYAISVEKSGLPLRYRGIQEYNIVPAVRHMTKYAKMVINPLSIRKEMQRAICAF